MKPAIYLSLFLSAISLQLTSARPLYIYHVDQSHGRAVTSSPATNNNHGRAVTSSPTTNNNNHGRDVAIGTYRDNQSHGRDLPGPSTGSSPPQNHAQDLGDSFSTIVGHFLDIDAVDVVANGISDFLGRS